ncbi:MAG: histone deacetylase [bacterium]
MVKIIYSSKYEIDIGQHVFKTEKYRMIHDKLIKEHVLKESDFALPPMPSDDDLKLAHTADYVQRFKSGCLTSKEVHQIELPYTIDLLEVAYLWVGGTIAACHEALKHGVGIHLGGGFHHAYADHGEGFCAFNDIAVAIRKLQKTGMIKRAMVIDCDLHQGNGTAKIFEGDDSVYTFSIHQELNYPTPKEKSSMDIGLPDETGDEEYMGYLQDAIPGILNRYKPDIIIYVAGADTYELDKLGGLALSIKGMQERDKFIFEEACTHKIPVAVVLAGGYAYDVAETVTIHANCIKTALRYIRYAPIA